jgi:hypothetical protein
MERKDLEAAVTNHATIQVTDLYGTDAGRTGTLQNYWGVYDAVEIEFMNEGRPGTRELSLVSRTRVELLKPLS